MWNVKGTISSCLLLLSAAAMGGCNGVGNGDLVERSAAAGGEPVSTALVPEGNASSDASSGSVMDEDWETWVAAEVSRIRSDNPELHDVIRSLDPSTTRARTPRFTSSVIHDPDVAPLLIDRFVNGNETDAVRAALIEALPRTGGSFSPAVVELMAREKVADVRTAMVKAIAHAKEPSAVAGLLTALGDTDPGVRVQAVMSVSLRGEGPPFADALVDAVRDSEQSVRHAAVQALGALEVAQGQEALVPLLGDDNAEMRFLALYSLERIDPQHAASLPRARSLRDDPDPRVAKLARRLAGE